VQSNQELQSLQSDINEEEQRKIDEKLEMQRKFNSDLLNSEREDIELAEGARKRKD